MRPQEKILDIAVQKLAKGKCCYYCHTKKNVVHHHLIRRADKLYRYDKRNLLPVCLYCHSKIHSGHLSELKPQFETEDIRSYLVRNSLTYDEFLQEKMKEFGISAKCLAKKYTKRTKNEKANEYRRKKWKEAYKKRKQWLKKRNEKKL